MIDFYDLIDTYATLNKIDKNEALHLWYRGTIDAGDLLKAQLNDEGIFGYGEHLINAITVLTNRAKKDNCYCPWID